MTPEAFVRQAMQDFDKASAPEQMTAEEALAWSESVRDLLGAEIAGRIDGLRDDVGNPSV